MYQPFNLPNDLFSKDRLPARDKDGHTLHPDWLLIHEALGADDEGEAAGKYIIEAGYEFKAICLENDADEAITQRFIDSEDCDCSYWTPSTPAGEGWLMLAIWDSEDGPVATYVRKFVD